MLTVHRVDTTNPRDVRRFVRFPFHLYRNCPQWVPPLVSSMRGLLDKQTHAFYRQGDADFFLAVEGKEVVGRIAVQEPRRRNAYHHKQGAFLSLFESVDDAAVARVLFSAAFEWARARGLNEISGPEGFVFGDGYGVLIDGFEHRPALGIAYNFPYYDRLFQEAGFRTQTDYRSYHLSQEFDLPERVYRIAEKVKERRGLEVLRFSTRDELYAVAPRVIEAFNTAFASNREFLPISAENVDQATDRILGMTRPELVKLVVKGQEIVGFLFGFPDVSAALQRCRGRLYPFGWAMLLWQFKRTRWVNFNGAGIIPQYQGLGTNALLYCEMYKTAVEQGFLHADLVMVNEQNAKMMQELEGLGIVAYKRHRLYEQDL